MSMESPRADAPDWKAEIVRLEQEANDAFLARDLARLDVLFSDDLLVNSPINRINDKPTLFSLLSRGIVRHVFSRFEHEMIRRDGDLVVVMGSDVVKDSESGPLVRRRFTNVWRKEDGRWRLYIRHANVIAQAKEQPPDQVAPAPA